MKNKLWSLILPVVSLVMVAFVMPSMIFEVKAATEYETINIKTTTSYERNYNTEPVILSVDEGGTNYEWKKDGVLIDGAAGYTLNLDGNVRDSGTYICTVTTDAGIVEYSCTVTIKPVRGFTFYAKTINVKPGTFTEEQIRTLQEDGVTSDKSKELGFEVGLIYSTNLSEGQKFIADGEVKVKLGEKQVRGDVEYYPVLVCYTNEDSEFTKRIKDNYFETKFINDTAPNPYLYIKPEPTITWSNEAKINGITVQYTGQYVELPDECFTVTGKDGEHIDGGKRYEYYVLVDIFGKDAERYREQIQTALHGILGELNKETPQLPESAMIRGFLSELSMKGIDISNAQVYPIVKYYAKAVFEGNDDYLDVISDDYVRFYIDSNLIKFEENDVFSLVDADSRYDIYDIHHTFVTEFTGNPITLTEQNVTLNKKWTGNVIIEYMSENDTQSEWKDDLEIIEPGNYYVRVTATGTGDYAEFSDTKYALLSVKPAKLTVFAKDQTIALGIQLHFDFSSIFIEGKILDVNPVLISELTTALEQCLPLGIFEIGLEDDEYVTAAGTYPKGIKLVYHPERLPAELALVNYLFDIQTVPGTLTVLDTSYVDEAIQKVKDDLQEKTRTVMAALESKADASTLAQAVNDIDTLKTQLEELSSKVSTDYATKAELKTAINDAKTAINNTIAELTTRVKDLETAIKEANAKINLKAEKTDVTAVKDDMAVLEKRISEAENLISDLKSLHIKDVNDLKSELEKAVIDANTKLDQANAKIAELEGKVKDLETAKAELEAAVAALKTAIGNVDINDGDLVTRINGLSTAIEKAQDAIENLNDTYATDEELAEEVGKLDNKITEAQKALEKTITALKEKVSALETSLKEANAKIDLKAEKTDVTAVKDGIVELEKKLTTAEKLIADLKALHIKDVESIKESLQKAVDDANAKIAAAEDRIATLEGKVSALETAKKKLEADVAALQSAVATKAETQALTDAINSLNASISEAKEVARNYTDAEIAELKSALEDADATINSAINELKERVTKLETDLKEANDKIDLKAEKTDVTAVKGGIVELEKKLTTAEKLIAELKALHIKDVESIKESLQKAVDDANAKIAAAEKRIAELEGKVEDLKKDQEALEKAVAELGAAMTSSNEALVKEIKDLNAALEAAKKAASDADAELKKAIETAEAALKVAIDELNNRVTVIESVLTTANANINTNATDIATLKANIQTIELLQAAAEQTIAELGALAGTNEANIAELQESITKLQESIYAADGKIAAAEARIAVLEGKVEELEGVKNELQASVANLQAALATKADRATVNNAISALQASITALQMAQNNYVYADMMLKQELTAAIDAAKELAISAAKELVSESATELQAEIDKKADSATLEAKAGELAAAVIFAESTSKAYADAQDAILKEAVDAELRAANELIASLGIRMTDAEAAIDALEAAVEALEKATADDAQALKDAVAAMGQALADAKAMAAEADTALETALNLMITEAQKSLEAKISDVQSKLNKAIKDLKAADASNADELKKAIKAIEEAMAAAESARDAADGALESKLTEAQNELSRKIAEVQANLDTAKDELNKALESGDTALGEKIKALNDALEAAKAATEASDVALKTELTTKIDEADAAIYALIEKIQKELQQANAELNTAMEEGDDELNTMFIISTSIAGVGVAGNIALLAWILISKKKKLF